MNETTPDNESRMRRLFFPGPALLFVAGWWGTSASAPPAVLLGLMLLVSVPCSLVFALASARAFLEQNRRE